MTKGGNGIVANPILLETKEAAVKRIVVLRTKH